MGLFINDLSSNSKAPVFYNEHKLFFQSMNDPIVLVSGKKCIFHNESAFKLFKQYALVDIDTYVFTTHLDQGSNSYLSVDTGLKLPVHTWQEIIWMEEPAHLIILKKTKRRESVKSNRKKVTSSLSLDSNQEQVMMVEIDMNGNISSANESFCSAHQIEPGIFGDLPFLPLISQLRENQTIEDFLNRQSNLKKPFVFEHHMLTDDNDHFWEKWTLLPVYSQDNKLSGLQGLGQDITEVKWNEGVQKAIFNISQATIRETRLDDIFRWIQYELNLLMPAENMYIALADYEKKLINYNYFVNQYDQFPEPKFFGNGLTEYVLQSGKPLLLSAYSDEELQQMFGILPETTASVDWLGCPLKYNQETIGVIAVQTYDIHTRYNKRQIELLELISYQIALSIIRKRTEEEMRENEEKYRALFESSQDAIFLEDLDGNILEANETALKMFGYTKEEMASITIDKLMPAQKKTTVTAILRLERKHDTSEHSSHGIRKNGEIFPNLTKTCKIRIRNEENIVVTIKDLLNDQVQEETIKLQTTILESVANAVMITDLSGYINWINPAFTELTGYSAEEIIGKHSSILNSNVHDIDFYNKLWNTIESGKVWQGEIINQHKNGESYYEEMTITPVLDEDGQIKQYVAIKQNINQRKKRESELEAIAAMTSAMRNAITQKEIFSAILEKLMELMQGGGALICLYQPDLDAMVIECGAGEWRNLTNQKIPKLAGVAGYVIRTGEVYIDNDAVNNGLFYFQEEIKKVAALAAAPLIMQDEVIGTLIIGTKKAIKEGEIRLLLTMCNLVSGVVYRANLSDQVRISYQATIQGWARALEIREQEKKGHSQNVVFLTEALARRVGLSESEILDIINGAYLHDIGKMGIPDEILFKPGKYTHEDWEVMHHHPIYARQLLERIPNLGNAIHVPYYHHEYWNGNGYPEGLAGEDIPIFARIFAIIDVWDALLTPRIYRPAWSRDQVIKYIKAQSGIQFDPKLVPIFLDMIYEMGLSEETIE
ncbi:MAG: hypothetical protein BGO78_08765 [Chloroflexi bacterium 44-23]|nr:MAG: hypothetical protein BGO78_08765 [Chloroflexi bacterium 44-23]